MIDAPAYDLITRPARLPIPSKPSDELRRFVEVTFSFREDFGPALRSAIDEISNAVGARLTGSHRFSKEQALTDAVMALGSLRKAVNRLVPVEDPNYV